ncbi:hypothetical protein ACH4FX_24540 [Streptomyces sp. NPDC018019]|uniref:hypothetical protein n=1 Tax=Streptomyces sp. NPDC018019 TaxID=3365030 RepID=UPI0037B099A9
MAWSRRGRRLAQGPAVERSGSRVRAEADERRLVVERLRPVRRRSCPGARKAGHRELQRRQRATDVALLREYVPGLPEAELEPLGEAIRSSLYGLALWWLDRPEQPREVLVRAMVRITRGLAATAGD